MFAFFIYSSEITTNDAFTWDFPRINTEVCLDLPSVSKATGGRKHLNRKSVASRIDNKTGGYLGEKILFDVEMGRIRKKTPISFVTFVFLSVCPSACINSAPTERIFVKI